MWPSTWTSQPPQSTPHGMCGLPPTATPGPMGTHLVGQQHVGAPHELPFMVGPTQHGSHWHPNYGPRPPMSGPLQQPHQQALPFSNCYSETTRICRTAHLPQQGPPMVFLIAAHNQWRLNFKYLVLLQSKNHQYTQYQCHTNNNLLLQSQQRQQLYLPHIKNLMHQPQKFLAGTLKLWRTDLMLPLRRSWRVLLQL